MATISCDRRIQIFPEDVNSFLEASEYVKEIREETKKYFALKESQEKSNKSKFFALAGNIDIDETAVKALREVSKI